ncbi:SRPBCC family protein [Flaviaesturariibacter aridisoli]|uniref:SRPBCC domain-containing protein n=1 Tax=Flaviaesturariibacter aridisoli TaxID=2545761 RepID=A0A4V2WM55_9BACT|nr:SRPBCC domain-containing protein [Flaviaesturariibacter aridisoli]TCZ65872.1 SRPBCC domain-containing protein [Flaviaesturariibacter aridisoli]
MRDNEPIQITQVLEAAPAKVWAALTQPDEMKQWYFDIPGFHAEPGFEFSFNGGPEEGPVFVHRCRITEGLPPHLLAHTWRYEGYPGDTLVTFRLDPEEGDRTRLVLTHEGIETIAPHHPAFARENFVQGWTHIITKALPEYLAK